jgi:hypothetical protein
VLIFYLGGGTFDVSILTNGEGSLFEVGATAGDILNSDTSSQIQDVLSDVTPLSLESRQLMG